MKAGDEGLEPTSWAPADLAGIRTEVLYNAGLLQRCYEGRLQTDPDLAGSVLIHAHIKPSGEVLGQCIGQDSLGDSTVIRCVNDLISMGRYPEGSTVDVSFSFDFTPPTQGLGSFKL